MPIPIDWPMFLHAIPAVVFLVAYYQVLHDAIHKHQRALCILTCTILVTIACFMFETGCQLWQSREVAFVGYPIHRYNTWWWHAWCTEKDPFTNRLKFGYIDKSGQFVIDPVFDSAHNFSEGLALVSFEGTKGYIDKTGEVVIILQYRYAHDFSEGLAAIMLDKKWGYINKKGTVVIKPQFESVNGFHEGMAGIQMNGKYGFIDKSGNIVVEPQFDWVNNFSEGIAIARKDDMSFLIGTEGETILETQAFIPTGTISEGLARGYIKNEQGYSSDEIFLDKTGKIILDPQYDIVASFSEGLAQVQNFIPVLDGGHLIVNSEHKTGKCGYIDTSGREVVQLQYYNAFDYSEGLGLVMDNNLKSGYREAYYVKYLDQQGDPIINIKCNWAYSFYDSMARIRGKEKFGYIDKSGKVVIEPKFRIAKDFSEGLASVAVD